MSAGPTTHGWTAESGEVTPINDLREHVRGETCWCRPSWDEHILVHNSMDRREEYERGRKMS